MEKVLGYIELAKQEGGVIECGGKRKQLDGEFSDGYFVEPTVITKWVNGYENQSKIKNLRIFCYLASSHLVELHRKKFLGQ